MRAGGPASLKLNLSFEFWAGYTVGWRGHAGGWPGWFETQFEFELVGPATR